MKKVEPNRQSGIHILLIHQAFTALDEPVEPGITRWHNHSFNTVIA